MIFELGKYSGDNFFTSFNLFNNAIQIPSFLAIWEGGIAIHGGLIAFFIGVGLTQILLVLKKKQVEKVQAAEGI